MFTGAFTIWMFKGFRGSLDKELVSVEGRNSTKGVIRIILGFLIWIIIVLVVVAIFKIKTETQTYRLEDLNYK
jgi:hypothetical protein